MSPEVFVCDRPSPWLKSVMRSLGVAAVVAGVVLSAGFGGQLLLPGIDVVIAGGLAGLVTEIVVRRLRSNDRWVVDTGSGFHWRGGGGEETIDDADVVAVRLRRTPQFRGGLQVAVVRRFEVWPADRDAPLCMVNRIAVGQQDPLGNLIDRLVEDLTCRSASGLSDGLVLEGDGWQLTGMQLSIAGRGSVKSTISFAQIAKVATIGGKLAIWLSGEELPAARIDPGSKNAPVLERLLAEWSKHREATDESSSAGFAGSTGMGRLLFERRVTHFFWLALMNGLLAAGVGIGSLASETDFWGGMLTAAGAIAILGGAVWGRAVFRCYELGLLRLRAGREARMTYAEIVRFDYEATRMVLNGFYTGTSFSLAFRSEQRTLRLQFNTRNADDDLDGLRDHIARIIADRMLAQLRGGEAVSWGDDAVFLADGLEIKRKSLLGLKRRPPERVPYDHIAGLSLNEGHFHLFRRGTERSIYDKPASSPNFFPGLYLLQAILEPGAAGQEEAVPTGSQGGSAGA